MKPLLVTGGSGQVGSAVIASAGRYGFDVIAPGRDALDLEKPDKIEAFMSGDAWSAVINCAAYTAVDKAESDAERAHLINASAPGALARAAAKHGIPIIHVSTDYVFDGRKPAPYAEDDPVAPLGVYGATKLAGEQAVIVSNAAYAIVRTAWVVSAGNANFINTMLRLAGERDEVSVVNDQLGCPSSAGDIATALLIVAKAMTGQGAARSGIWHFVNAGEASWHDLAAFVFAEAAARGHKTPVLHAIPTSAYPTPAVRPANSRLETSRFQKDFGYKPRQWQTAIADIMTQRLGPIKHLEDE